MQYLFSVFLILTLPFIKPDPKARKLMDKVHSVYEKASSLDISFSYEQTNSDIAGLSKKGQLLSKGEKFKLILDELEIYSDGKTQYTYLKKNKEVQITEPDDKENKYHPKYISGIYQSDTHEYSISKKIKDGNKSLVTVDFQTKDKTDPISKIKLFIDEKSNQINKVQWIEQDGDKTIVNFSKTQFNKSIPDTSFVLDLKSLKGIHVEDLR
jgi:outer membrane lipoprotein-sorting protein